MTTRRSTPIKIALLAALAEMFVSAASASIIYQDNFGRVGSLNGSAPTVDNTGSSATWTATAGYTCTGTNGFINNSINSDWQGGAHLPLDWTTSYPDPHVQVDAYI